MSHDFYSNLQKGSQSGDKRVLEDIFIDSFSDILLSNYQQVVDLLEMEKIPVEKPVDVRSLTAAVLKYLPQRKNVGIGISYLIVDYNEMLVQNQKNPENTGAQKDMVAKVADIFHPFFASLNQTPVYDKIFNGVMNQLKVKSESEMSSADAQPVSEKKEKKSNNMIWIALGIGVVALGAWYFISRRKSAGAPQLAAGSMAAAA